MKKVETFNVVLLLLFLWHEQHQVPVNNFERVEAFLVHVRPFNYFHAQEPSVAITFALNIWISESNNKSRMIALNLLYSRIEHILFVIVSLSTPQPTCNRCYILWFVNVCDPGGTIKLFLECCSWTNCWQEDCLAIECWSQNYLCLCHTHAGHQAKTCNTGMLCLASRFCISTRLLIWLLKILYIQVTESLKILWIILIAFLSSFRIFGYQSSP